MAKPSQKTLAVVYVTVAAISAFLLAGLVGFCAIPIIAFDYQIVTAFWFHDGVINYVR